VVGGFVVTTSDRSISSICYKEQSGPLVGKGHGQLLFLRLRFVILV